MREYKWRTSPSGTEGTTTVYVDSYTGSDLYGDGTRTNPYKTLTKAFNAKGNTKPTTIVCRGTFSESLTGNHSTEIVGDYFGAATFDGKDTHMLYGFGHSKMIVKNILPLPSSVLAGVGRANTAGFAGVANVVFGVCGSSALFARCTHYMGVLGCTHTGAAANRNCVFARPRAHSDYRISIAGQGTGVQSNTYVNCAVEHRKKHYGQNERIYTSLFANFAMIANDAGNDEYINCLFAADCKWYYFTGETPNSTYYELAVTGSTSAERQASLLAALTAKYDELEVASSSRKFPVFTGCVFSSQTAADLFNNPDMDDYTLKPGCDADVAVSGAAQYYGALPPAINIPIMDDSTGHPGTWDEHTASGCVIIVDNQICADVLSDSDDGEILSKVIVINPATTQLNGVFAQFNSQFGAGAYANRNSIFEDTPYAPGDILPQGRYLALTEITYDGNTINAGDVFVVSQDNTSFTGATGATALGLIEPNVMEVLYCRCRAAVYARVGVGDDLQAGATYLNDSGETITYHNRSISNGESFVCMIAGERFSCTDPTATIAVLFDDTRVPSVDWVPAQVFGEYFVAKRAGAIGYDEFGVPLSSGNYMSYQTPGLLKSTLDRAFVQFAVKVKRYGE